MADAGKVRADLVRPARLDAHLEVSEAGQAVENAVLGDGRPALRAPGRHPDAPRRVARDGLLDPPLVPFENAVDQRQVDLLYRAAGELRRQAAMRRVGASHQQDSAGEPVQAVDDAGPLLPATRRQRAEMVEQRVHQRARVAAGPGMNHHARGLIHRNHVRVFVEDLDRKVLRIGPQRLERGRLHFDGFPAPQAARRALAGAVHAHAARLAPILQSRPAVFGKLLLQKHVQPLARIRPRGVQDHC